MSLVSVSASAHTDLLTSPRVRLLYFRQVKENRSGSFVVWWIVIGDG